jgi:mono/diheme cytochrome c family protein
MTRNLSLKLAVIALGVSGTLAAFAFSGERAEASVGDMQSSGAAIYSQHCARCHGDDGEGDKGPEINSARKQARYRSNPQGLISKISRGGGKMPRFSSRLSASQIRAVADFVRTL